MNQPLSRRFQLSTIEPTTDITGGTPGLNGTLVLSRYEEIFQMHWTPFDGTLTQHVNAINHSPSNFKGEVWKQNAQFKIDCSQIALLQIHPEPLSISIYRNDKQGKRTFAFNDTEFISMTEMVEQLIINGIAVPSTQEEYSLEFYRRCHRGVYPYTPPHIQLNVDTNIEIPKFWDCLHQFFQTLIIHLDSSDTLPKDPQFPLGSAARAAHNRVLKEIDEYGRNLPKYEKITKETFDDLFDENGKIKDYDSFRKRIFFNGLDSSILAKALPFVFGVYKPDSTYDERKQEYNEMEEEFYKLLMQASAYKEEQINNNKRVASAFRVIKHDVSRTDRHLNAFKNKDARGLTMITNLLKSYSVFNPPIGYLQGMNDLFVPILLAYLPNWSEEGIPLDDNGNEIDEKPFLPQIFWCFDAMLRNIDHMKLLAKVTELCQNQAKLVSHILDKVSPLAGIWMKRSNLRELLWCYSDFVLLFKRTFNDIWPVWLQMNCSPHPNLWLTYFVAAIIVRAFDQLVNLPDVTITTMMDAFPRIIKSIELSELCYTSLWLSEKVPLKSKTSTEVEGEIKTSGFQFFETYWTGRFQN